MNEILKHSMHFAVRDHMEMFEVVGRVTVRATLWRQYDSRPMDAQRADALGALRRDIAVLLRCQPSDIDIVGNDLHSYPTPAQAINA